MNDFKTPRSRLKQDLETLHSIFTGYSDTLILFQDPRLSGHFDDLVRQDGPFEFSQAR